jgi:hypothetical protein
MRPARMALTISASISGISIEHGAGGVVLGFR